MLRADAAGRSVQENTRNVANKTIVLVAFLTMFLVTGVVLFAV